MTTAPESVSLRIGFVPLVDAAPLIVAAEYGFFAAQGLDVELVPLAAWASVRDRLGIGQLDSAHLLAPMLPASQLGLDGLKVPLTTALVLAREGNAIVVSSALYEALRAELPAGGSLANPLQAGQALAAVVRTRAARGRPRLCFAHVHPHSMHHFLFQQWLAGAGLDAMQDVRLSAIAPPQASAHLEAGAIDGFCTGAPWGLEAESTGHGRVLFGTAALAPGHPEKVLAVREAWAEAHPAAHLALVTAVMAAQQWLSAPENLPMLAAAMTTAGRLPGTATAFVEHWRAGGTWPSFGPLAASAPEGREFDVIAQRLLRLAGQPDSSTSRARAQRSVQPAVWQAACERLGTVVAEQD